MTTPPEVATLAAAFTQLPPNTSGYSIGPHSDLFFVVQAFNAYPTDVFVWDVSFWSDGTTGDFWAGAGGWQDITDRVRGVSWTDGATDSLARPEPGTAAITLDNRDGLASPWSTSVGGPFSTTVGAEGPTWLQPGAFVRFGMYRVVAGVTIWYPFLTGTIETMPEDSSENVDGWVTLNLVELTAQLGAFNGAEQSPIGAGDSLDQRIARLLADATWQSGYVLDADPVGSTATFQATTMAQNRLAELYLTADSVGMRVVSNGAGKLCITSPYPPSTLAATAVFSNLGVLSLPLVKVTPYASTDRIVNVVIAARAGSAEQTVQDNYSIQKYGRLDPGGSRDDLIVESDGTVLAMLQRQVRNAANDALGIENIELDMDMDPTNLPLFMAQYASTGLTVRTPFVVRWVHPSGAVFDGEMVISGMTHNITPIEPGAQIKWTCTLSTAHRVVSAPGGVWGVDFWDSFYWTFPGVYYVFPGYMPDIITLASMDATFANALRDRAYQVFDTAASRASAITSPSAGQASTLTSSAAGLYEYVGSVDGWTAPWNTGWGRVARTVDTAFQIDLDTAEHVITAAATTFTAVANRKYRITIEGAWENEDTGATRVLTIKVKDGSTLIEQPRTIAAPGAALPRTMPLAFSVETTLTAGAHTINVTQQSAAVGVGCRADIVPLVITIFDLGASGAPS